MRTTRTLYTSVFRPPQLLAAVRPCQPTILGHKTASSILPPFLRLPLASPSYSSYSTSSAATMAAPAPTHAALPHRKQFAPLSSRKPGSTIPLTPQAAGQPKVLRGVVFDVDGTLWWVSELSLKLFFYKSLATFCATWHEHLYTDKTNTPLTTFSQSPSDIHVRPNA